jgi:CheY-like chemotaxis protein
MNILIAEDDPSMVLMHRETLRRAHSDARVWAVSDGIKVIEYLRGQGEFENREDFPFPHIILLDLNMPRMNGFQVLEWLRANPLENTPYIFMLSDSEEQEQIMRSYELGASLYLVKPKTLKELFGLMQQILLVRLGQKVELETTFLRRR